MTDWVWRRYPQRRLRVLLPDGRIRTVTRGAVVYLVRVAQYGRRRRTSILGRCWIELSAEPATGRVDKQGRLAAS